MAWIALFALVVSFVNQKTAERDVKQFVMSFVYVKIGEQQLLG